MCIIRINLQTDKHLDLGDWNEVKLNTQNCLKVAVRELSDRVFKIPIGRTEFKFNKHFEYDL